ncbi:MAG: MBL fold metallo-hydrolase [Bacteroidota bacterium]
MIHTLDLNFLGAQEAIAAFCVPTDHGAVLVECGPMTVTENLVGKLAELDLKPADIKAVFLTHIHFDHAGAAWWWAEQGADIYVHPVGRPHLISPERLYGSATRIYGEQMEYLWGDMKPIAEHKVIEVEDEQEITVDGISMRAHFTPGHASHHIAWQLGENIFAGDVAGVKIQDGPVVPPCPPPDIDLGAWNTSIERLETLSPRRLYLTHYGPVEGVSDHLRKLQNRLEAYANWVKPHAEQGAKPDAIMSDFIEFINLEFAELGLTEGEMLAYQLANPPEMSLTGLLRYWHKIGLAT